MRDFILLCCFFPLTLILNSQTVNDSILAYERKIDRPLTLHRGQIQFNTAYKISIFSNEYDNNGNRINLADKGNASVEHKYFFELHYGIFDFLQASFELNYAKRGERHEIHYVQTMLNYEPDFKISWFDEYKGFDDLYSGAVIKLPLKTRKAEFAFSPGIYIPLFSNNPKQPEHSISFPVSNQAATTIIYHTNHNTGNGARAIIVGASAIVRPVKNISISAYLNYTWPISESKSVRWIHQLDGTDFVYDAVPYRYLIGSTLDYSVNLAYQAIPWFNVYLSYCNRKTSSGWSEIMGLRIGDLENKMSLLSVGYEIKATSRIWITEIIDISISGKNHLAPYSIYLELSYNLFPFNKKQKRVGTNKALN